ncbi:transporter, RND superfamily [Methanosarcina horonobensis HB-1 = JCM 15518]|uniref:Transporter, RND superfamily n=2 Tax=Methanosarcina horonobensis TaxID=418008 RepID=A0A0E3WWU8_9EURY|nr:RND family transporter [Methanosarcina horonobensis]AKB80325.1 transporter, RND superfamily [Methanosarcina horonobensis HB-1 = JCM 15518]
MQGAQLIEMKSGTETFVGKDSPLYQDYDHLYQSIFQTQSIVVMVEGNEVKNADLMEAVDRLEHQLRATNGVIETTSPASLIKTVNYQMTGRYELPETDEEIKAIIDGNPDIFSQIIPDNTHMLISVVMAGSASDKTQEDILTATEDAVSFAEFPPSYNIIVTGDPAFSISMNYEMNSSMGILLGLSAIFMLIVLLIVFKHVRWCILPLPVVLLGIVYTFGAMGYIGISMSMVTMSAFPILIGVGIDYAIQFHNRLEEEMVDKGNKSRAVIETIKHTGPAVLIALVMTALGFFSLFTSTVPMIQDFGKLLLIGIAMCYLASIFVGVVILSIFDSYSDRNPLNKITKKIKPSNPEKKKKPEGESESDRLIGKVLQKTTILTIKYDVIVLGIACLLCFGGLYLDQSVPIQTDVQTFVPQDMPALVDLSHMGDVMGGTDELNLIIKVEDTASPDVLKWIEQFSEHGVASNSHIYSASSIVDLVKEYNGGVIPDTSQEIENIYSEIPEAQKDRYIYGKNMLLLNFNIGNAVADIKVTGIKELTNIVEEDMQWMPAPPGTAVTITGNNVVFIEVITALTSGRVAMTFLGLVLVLIGLFVVYRDWVKALVPVIPMVIVIGWSGGVMSLLNISYTPLTATLGALILGVGSEYAILMMERYFEEKDKGLHPMEAINMASSKIGSAIVASGATTVFGFMALLASPFPMISDFGMVTVIDIVLALLATFVVFPPLMILLDTWRDKRKGSKAAEKQTEIKKQIQGAEI